jgi:hypothetical protein
LNAHGWQGASGCNGFSATTGVSFSGDSELLSSGELDDVTDDSNTL